MEDNKRRLIQKALKLAKEGEKIGVMVNDGPGDYMIFPIRCTKMNKVYQRANDYAKRRNWTLCTIEDCGGSMDERGIQEIKADEE